MMASGTAGRVLPRVIEAESRGCRRMVLLSRTNPSWAGVSGEPMALKPEHHRDLPWTSSLSRECGRVLAQGLQVTQELGCLSVTETDSTRRGQGPSAQSPGRALPVVGDRRGDRGVAAPCEQTLFHLSWAPEPHGTPGAEECGSNVRLGEAELVAWGTRL